MSYKSDRILKAIGLYNFANHIRTSTPNINGFKKGCYTISLASLLCYAAFRSHNNNSDINASKMISKLSQIRPMILNKLLEDLPLGEGRLHYFNRLDRLAFERYFKSIRMQGEGEFDHTKEIHILRTRNGEKGYDIITPFYYYDEIVRDDEFHIIDPSINAPERKLKGAISVHRGW